MSDTLINKLISPKTIELPCFNPKLQLGVLASGKGSNFEALINSTKGLLDAEIKYLIVNKECGAIDVAKKHKIPHSVISHESFKTREELDKALIDIFIKHNVEILIMAGWMRIVTSLLIEKYNKRLINIHPSLLPSFKGANAIEQALKAKVKFTGCTAHLVEKEVDSGEILIQGVVPINDSDNSYTLSTKIQQIEHKILYKAVALVGQRFRSNN